MSRRRLIVTVIAAVLYAAWGVLIILTIVQPSDPTEDMSNLQPLWDGVMAFLYAVGLLLFVRYARRGQVIRTAAVPVLIVPASLAAFLLVIFLVPGNW
jgi:hypothetical protein